MIVYIWYVMIYAHIMAYTHYIFRHIMYIIYYVAVWLSMIWMSDMRCINLWRWKTPWNENVCKYELCMCAHIWGYIHIYIPFANDSGPQHLIVNIPVYMWVYICTYVNKCHLYMQAPFHAQCTEHIHTCLYCIHPLAYIFKYMGLIENGNGNGNL